MQLSILDDQFYDTTALTVENKKLHQECTKLKKIVNTYELDFQELTKDINKLSELVMGEDYYIEAPVRNMQANHIILHEIYEKLKSEESLSKKIRKWFKKKLTKQHKMLL